MGEELKVEINHTNTCHGCLCSDRTLSYIGNNADILLVLMGSYRQCLVYAPNDLKFCWECMKMLKKLKSFQQQVRTAQAGLMKMLYGIDYHVDTLSKLSIVKKHFYNLDIKHESVPIKTEIEDIHSYSDVDNSFDHSDTNTENFDDSDSKVDESDNKSDRLDHKSDRLDNKSDRLDNKSDRLDNNLDTYDVKVNDFEDEIDIDDKGAIIKYELDISYMSDFKDEESIPKDKTTIITKPRPKAIIKNSECGNKGIHKKPAKSVDETNSSKTKVTNTYYKRYVTLVESNKSEWGSSEAVRSHFTALEFSEKQMEDHFLGRDRRFISAGCLKHKCGVCNLRYRRKRDLLRHNDLNHHKEGTPYICSLCNESQQSAEYLEKHWLTHSMVYRCNTCEDIFKENVIKDHLDRSHTKMYECNYCHRKFRTVKLFTIHFKEMHTKFVCDYCNRTVTTKYQIEKHIRVHHMEYTCKDCDKTYRNHTYYLKHRYTSHPDKSNNKNYNPELSFCVECNKQFPSVEKYKNHLRESSKHNKKVIKLPCSECGKVFSRKNTLRYHYNLFHLKKTEHYCKLCDKYFARSDGLRAHQKVVHLKIKKVKDKICDFCGRAFSSTVVLRHHRLTHTGERPHKCPHCAAEFIQKYAMQSHVRTQHKDEKVVKTPLS